MQNHQIIWHEQLRCEVYAVNDDFTLDTRIFDLPEAFGDHVRVEISGYEFPNPFSRTKEEAREARAARQAMENLLRRGPIYLTKMERGRGVYKAKVFYGEGELARELEKAGFARKADDTRSIQAPWFTDGELKAIRGD